MPCLNVVGEIDGHKPEKHKHGGFAESVIRQRIGSGAIGEGKHGYHHAHYYEPPLAVEKQSAAHGACRHKGGKGDIAQGGGLDVALGDAAAWSHATFFVGSAKIIVVFVGEIAHHLCQYGKKQAEHRRHPSFFAKPHSHSYGYHHTRHRHRQGAQAYSLYPHFQSFHFSLLSSFFSPRHVALAEVTAIGASHYSIFVFIIVFVFRMHLLHRARSSAAQPGVWLLPRARCA